MGQINERILDAARIIWNYHQLRHKPIRADVIIALGTNDLRVAEFAATSITAISESFSSVREGLRIEATCSRRLGAKTEAEMYAGIAVQHGVPIEHILLETHATNTAENIRFARELLLRRSIQSG